MSKAKDTTSEAKTAITKLHPLIARLAREGPYHDPHRVAVHASLLGPAAVEELLSDPDMVGCYVADPAAREEYIVMARWLEDNHPSCPGLRALADEYCVVKHFGNKVRVFFLRAGRWCHVSPEEFRKAHANEPRAVGWSKRGPKPVLKSIADVWLEHPANAYYETAEFLPGSYAPPGVLNLWIPPRLKRHPATSIPADDNIDWYRRWNDFPDTLLLRVPKFAEHMLTNMCGGDEDYYRFLVGWMVDALLNMHRTGEVAVVLRGPQGSGKGFWIKHFMELFTPHHVTLNKPGQLTDNFNAHLQMASMVFCDEAFFGGSEQTAGTLKVLITDTELFIVPKGIDGFMAAKTFRVVISSNSPHVIRAARDDRRMFVLEVDAGDHNDDGEYFKAIDLAWVEEERDALFYWFTSPEAMVWLERCWDSHDRPETEALGRQKDESLLGAEKVVDNMLRQGEPPCPCQLENGLMFVPTRLLIEATGLKVHQETALGRAIGVLSDGAKSVKVILGEEPNRKQHRGHWLPPLAVARARWEEHLGRSVDWPEDVQDWEAGDDVPF